MSFRSAQSGHGLVVLFSRGLPPEIGWVPFMGLVELGFGWIRLVGAPG